MNLDEATSLKLHALLHDYTSTAAVSTSRHGGGEEEGWGMGGGGSSCDVVDGVERWSGGATSATIIHPAVTRRRSHWLSVQDQDRCTISPAVVPERSLTARVASSLHSLDGVASRRGHLDCMHLLIYRQPTICGSIMCVCVCEWIGFWAINGDRNGNNDMEMGMAYCTCAKKSRYA